MADTQTAVLVLETATAFVRTLEPIIVPKSQVLLDRIAEDIEEAADIDVCSESMAAIGLEIAGRISTVLDAIDAERLATTKPVREAQAWVNDGYKPTIDMLTKAKSDLGEKLKAWNRKVVEDKRKQDLADAAARKAIADKAEADRIEVERVAQELVKKSSEAAASGDMEQADLLATQAQVTVDAARQQETQALATQHVPTGVVVAASSGVKGVSVKWRARVTDKAKFLLRVVNEPRLLDMIDINDTKLNQLAGIEKERFSYPGVEAYPEDNLRVSKRGV